MVYARTHVWRFKFKVQLGCNRPNATSLLTCLGRLGLIAPACCQSAYVQAWEKEKKEGTKTTLIQVPSFVSFNFSYLILLIFEEERLALLPQAVFKACMAVSAN